MSIIITFLAAKKMLEKRKNQQKEKKGNIGKELEAIERIVIKLESLKNLPKSDLLVHESYLHEVAETLSLAHIELRISTQKLLRSLAERINQKEFIKGKNQFIPLFDRDIEDIRGMDRRTIARKW